MTLKALTEALTVCKVKSLREFDFNSGLYFIGKTDEELSLVCETKRTPSNTTARDDGWRGFRIEGVLDFSLIGVLSRLTAILAANQIGVFAVSTYNTDYILVKEESFDKALKALAAKGYQIEKAA